MNMGLKEVSVFKTKKTLKALDSNAFKGGKPKLQGGLPPIIDDPESAEKIENSSKNAVNLIETFI